MNKELPIHHTSLTCAAAFGTLDDVKAAIKSGADINEKKVDGWGSTSALTLAVIYRHRDIAAYLIDQGIDLDHSDPYGLTALDYLIRQSDDELTHLLLKNGAKITDRTLERALNALAFEVLHRDPKNPYIPKAKKIVKLLISNGLEMSADQSQRYDELDAYIPMRWSFVEDRAVQIFN